MSVFAQSHAARTRSAVSPLRRRFVAYPVRRPTVDEVVAADRPEQPLHCLRPATIAATARDFVQAFPGDVLYAVKCNPDPAVLRALWDGGVRHFDCASLPEIRLVRDMFPDAAIHFMHPVKARGAIREAWERHGVRDFVLDSADELAKIRTEAAATGVPGALGLIVRIALPKLDLSGKFGADFDAAVPLLLTARVSAARLGVSFHVGSQCLDPLAWRDALLLTGRVIHAAGVKVDVIDVGGGFPVAYPDQEPPPPGAFFAEIEAGFERIGSPGTRLWAEPGRALVAAGTSVVVQVQARRGGARGDVLYINDGVYGSLADAGNLGFRYPVRLIRPSGVAAAKTIEYSLFGPTCDSADAMRGPFVLPADAAEGDWIEIGQLGAYGACLRTAFNGCDRARIIEVADKPMLETPACGTPALRDAA